ncbi:MAG: hypothetical protein IPM36_23965 [Lewinellaceae bacterium]|nr:hypothetical protein [Lewinellaceae bacterium]
MIARQFFFWKKRFAAIVHLHAHWRSVRGLQGPNQMPLAGLRRFGAFSPPNLQGLSGGLPIGSQSQGQSRLSKGNPAERISINEKLLEWALFAKETSLQRFALQISMKKSQSQYGFSVQRACRMNRQPTASPFPLV